MENVNLSFQIILSETIKIGELDRRILFQNPVETKQSNGELLISWNSHGYRWAKVEPFMATEINENERLSVYSKATFTVRYDSALNEKMRIYFDGKIYNIQGYTEIGRRQFMTIEAETRQIANALTADDSSLTVDSTLLKTDQEWQ